MTPSETTSWQAAIDDFWATVSGFDELQAAEHLDHILSGHAVAGPHAEFERASLDDYYGREAVAIGGYERALDLGLSGPKRSEALIQLGSSLRNVGRADEAVAVLSRIDADDPLYADAQAFMALALFDAGHQAGAVATALRALAPALKVYSRPVRRYATALEDS